MTSISRNEKIPVIPLAAPAELAGAAVPAVSERGDKTQVREYQVLFP